MPSTYTDQLTIHGHVVFCPTASTMSGAEAVRAFIRETVSVDADFCSAMQHISMLGARIEWSPWNDSYAIVAPDGSWMRGWMSQHEGDAVGDVLVWGVEEAAKAWGLSLDRTKRIMHLVPGAYKAAAGNIIRWLVPAGSAKPTDGKRGPKPAAKEPVEPRRPGRPRKNP